MPIPFAVGLTPSTPVAPSAPKAASGGDGTPGFADTFSRLLRSVDDSSASANQAVDRMLKGTGDVHEAMIALHHEETALNLTVQVRNKLVQAYQDVMKMPV